MRVSFGDGTSGEAIELEGQLLRVIVGTAYPPGRPLELSLELGGGEYSLRAKSIGSKRRPDQRFDVRMRLVDLRRDLRVLLQNELARPVD